MKNPHAQALGRLGGLAKARRMTQLDREAQADRAAQARAAKAKRAKIQKELTHEPSRQGPHPPSPSHSH